MVGFIILASDDWYPAEREQEKKPLPKCLDDVQLYISSPLDSLKDKTIPDSFWFFNNNCRKA